MIVVGNNRR